MRRLAACIVLGLVVARPPVALANDRAAAKAAFQEGEAAEKRKDWRAAIDAYQRAYDLSPHPFALYNIAVNYERVGELREAATFYQRYLDEATDPQDRARVERLVENLRKRPSTVSIRTTPPGGEVWLDGAPIGRAPLSRSIPGGAHQLSARQGDRRENKPLTVEYGEPADVVIELAEQQGTLVIASNVNGAAVEIDGVPSGQTPLTVEVKAGVRKVIVRAEGYASLERVVKVPAEGSAQITATLVRPLGYIEPQTPSLRSYVVGFEYDRAVNVDANFYHVAFGWRIMSVDLLGRIGTLGDSTFGYGVELRLFLMKSRIRPYLAGLAEYAASSSTSGDTPTVRGIVGGAGGILVEGVSGGRFALDFLVQGGVVWVGSSTDDNTLAYPVGGSIVLRGR